MSHTEIDKTLQMIVNNTTELLKGHGFDIVTEDKILFPYFMPGLAALRSGRLLVFGVFVFPKEGEFLEEIEAIQSYFNDAVEQNTPESDPRVQIIEKVALVMAPETIEDKVPAGDIHWIGIGSLAELTDRLRRELAL
ncbi:MAG: hypothetical protein ACM3US_11045 [Sphingomonadaceae bacterium]